ncbi:MAG: monophosphatase [Solirubrobacteraceae bacterium]|nr:monophosphatase [Solirubrobacteraceae bacterium]
MTPDLDLAARAVRAGAAAALAVAADRLDVEVKGAPSDLVSRADRAAERAIADLLAAERPADGIVGEEGASVEGGARRWLVDGIDGTFNFLSGIPHWCVAVGLEEDGVPVAGAVYDPVADELFAGARDDGATRNGEPIAVREGRSLDQAAVATFLRSDKGADRATALGTLIERVGILRTGGAGSLELSWVAAGRVDAWAQPNVSAWDWVPGAAIVSAAGGRCVVLDGDPAWHIAGAPALVAELADLVPRG